MFPVDKLGNPGGQSSGQRVISEAVMWRWEVGLGSEQTGAWSVDGRPWPTLLPGGTGVSF